MTQQATKKISVFQRIFLVTSAVLFIILVLAQMVPLSYGSSSTYISQATLQLARSNGFAKNALILQDATQDKATHSQALSDIQVSFSLFVDEQNVLLRSNQDRLQEAKPYYLALIAAIQIIANGNASSVELVQAGIIIQNSRAYNTSMNQFLMILQQQANDFNAHLVVFQEVVAVLIGGCFVWLHIIGMRRLKTAMTNKQEGMSNVQEDESHEKGQQLVAHIEHLAQTNEGFRCWLQAGIDDIEAGRTVTFSEEGWREPSSGEELSNS